MMITRQAGRGWWCRLGWAAAGACLRERQRLCLKQRPPGSFAPRASRSGSARDCSHQANSMHVSMQPHPLLQRHPAPPATRLTHCQGAAPARSRVARCGAAQDAAPLVDALWQRGNRDDASFHVPGHKVAWPVARCGLQFARCRRANAVAARHLAPGCQIANCCAQRGKGVTGQFQQLAGSSLGFDLTEIAGLDYLSSPTGVIDQAQRLAAELFGADHTWFLVNGCSGGIHAAVMATCGPGQTLLVARNCHLSVFSAMVLAGEIRSRSCCTAGSPPAAACRSPAAPVAQPLPARSARRLQCQRLSTQLPAPQAASPGGSSRSAISSTASRTASHRRRCARPCSRRSRQGATWAPSCSYRPPTTAPQLAWQVGRAACCTSSASRRAPLACCTRRCTDSTALQWRHTSNRPSAAAAQSRLPPATHQPTARVQSTLPCTAELADICHQHGLPLLVDEAHGAHFGLHPAAPASALSCGADLVVQSTHKTLSSMTQSAMLHLRGPRAQPRRVSRALQTLQSSSPSYLLMASLDAARQLAATPGFLDGAVAAAQAARAGLQAVPGLRLLGTGGGLAAGAGALQSVAAWDPLRVVVDTAGGLGLGGFQAAALLEEQHGG
jgi:hypothetical protein